MINNFLKLKALPLLIVVFVASCNSNPKQKLQDNIVNLEKDLYNSESFNKDKATQLVDLYISYSDQYADDSLAAPYVYKAAEIAMNLNLSKRSVSYFDRVRSEYPEFDKTPECLFLKAFIYENQLNNLEIAAKLYKEFIEKYPNHALVNDAEASLKFLGKSPEELVKIFQEMNQDEQN